ncbi:monosaccharide ABC transporter substrate-binding protein (CUT2 family) [Anseongella ginsenosidimutans]|uniref:Monosaccharide ABC transporter substrate-binding protein (CUT2 family) n=1 Tax=Anseongella ginsenosidimutans TaxID=496056 RepID=A0A4V2UTZ9_9SPHI|nr:sugar ABC transporter substrate-binding protein [Anseongella ginsenosidimutans]TCS88442.1 monosaccharide ABC transporter substrate-binding protein (CUT2 family) [Anseongella ginsenosidimutans]
MSVFKMKTKVSDRNIRSFAGIGVLAVLLSACQGGGQTDGKLVIGASMLSLQSEFIVKVKDAMEAEASEQQVKLIVNDAQRAAVRQVQQVESFIAQGVDAIILNPCEMEASSPAVQKAKEAGIPIINVNSETSAEPDGFVGSRDEESAEIALEHIVNLLDGRGNIVVMHGYMGQAAQLKRAAATKTVLADHPGITILAEQTAEWDRAKAMSLMENWIQSYGSKINAVFAQNDEMGMGALQALEQAGLKEKVVVVSIDAIDDALRAVKEGRLDATVYQNADEQGRKAVQMAVDYIQKSDSAAGGSIYIPFQLVTRENVDHFLK